MPNDVTDKQPYLDRSLASIREVIKIAEDYKVILNMEAATVSNSILLTPLKKQLNMSKLSIVQISKSFWILFI